jgi:hypothetical protein
VDADVADAAVISTDVGPNTAEVETVNVPEMCPKAIVIPTGTETTELLLDRLAITPLGPAGSSNVTVPVADCPPMTDAGLTLTPDTAAVPARAGLITSVVLAVLPEVAVMVAVTEVRTDEVEIVNDPLV